MEFEANTRLQDTTFSFGYHLTLPQANMVFRGEGHSDGIRRCRGLGGTEGGKVRLTSDPFLQAC